MKTGLPGGTKPLVHIQMVHDLVCSWCPIGYTNLSDAIADVEGQVDVTIDFLPFQLNSEMGYEGEEIEAHLMRRTGQSKEQLATYRRNLIATGKKAGFEFDFSKRTHYYNSLKGHLLLNAAHGIGKQREVLGALHRAYHQEGGNLADDGVIMKAGVAAGLDPAFIDEALTSTGNRREVKAKETKARSLGVRSVPTFFVNGNHTLPGSNNVGVFRDVLLATARGQKAAAG